jgi:uncharacterized protein (TIGR03083 family)
MSKGGAEAPGLGVSVGLGADRDALVDLLGALPDGLWAAPSGCRGWSVKDVVAHLGALFWTMVDRSALPDTTGLGTERAQDVYVAGRADWTGPQVLEDYATVSAPALRAIARLEDRPDRVVTLGDLGSYPAPLLGAAFAFDHYTHLRADLFGRGPLPGTPPPSDELRLRPALAWVMAALPQQSAAALARLPGAVEVDLSGPSGGTWYVERDQVAGQPGEDVVARVRCSTHDLVLWVTRRATWDDLGVGAEGDETALAVLRDGVKVF